MTRLLLAVLLFGFIGGLLSFPLSSEAASFNQIFIRPDILTKSSQTGGLICANPASVATESKVVVVFPSSYDVNTTASNWTVDTSDLPPGASAWTGIGTANAISGQTVTFPSGDLNSGTLYCFNFALTNTLTNPSSSGEYEGNIQTKNAGNTTIDGTSIGFAVMNAGPITVSASVGNNPNNFTTVTESSSGNGPFKQGTVLDYQVTYSSNSSSPASLTLEASWTQGSLEGGGSSSINVLEYVVGSASNGYNNVSPVIDTTNRTISWIIPVFPGNTTGQTVSFQLRTTSNYSGTGKVNFSVSSHLSSTTFVSADSTLNQQYQFVQDYSSPIPTSSASPNASTNPASSFSVSSGEVSIQNVEIKEITRNSAKILVTLSNNASLTLLYGNSTKTPNKSLISLQSQKIHQFDLIDLTENEPYYFRLQYKNSQGKLVTTELFTFKTASESDIPQFDLSKLLLVSSTSLNYPGLILDQNNLSFILPINTDYEFKLPFTNYKKIKKISVTLQNNQVLGLNTVFAAETNINEAEMIEVYPGIYSAKLRTPVTTDNFQMMMKVEDYSGNIFEKSLFHLFVVPPFEVKNQQTGGPVENAKVSLSIYNDRVKLYDNLENKGLDIENPLYSNFDGEVKVVLPPGKYRAEISAPGYESQIADFSINPSAKEAYPQVALVQKPWSMATFIEYHSAILSDLIEKSTGFISSLAESSRLFQFMSLMVISTTAGLSILAISLRKGWGIREWLHLPWIIRGLFRKQNILKNIQGVIQGEDKSPLIQVEIIIMQGEKVVKKIYSGKNGKFAASVVGGNDIKLLAAKDGYQLSEVEWSDEPVTIKLEKNASFIEKAEEITKATTMTLLDSLAETLLILAILLELFFFRFLPPLTVLPFFCISLLNLLIWGVTTNRSKLAS